ncbi:hypothetical protein ACIQXA_08625 [Streptomyces massasporeus]|uniref:hypothetical protein n=1 Tax=Streptomyces massasporeus TaxID=67324 RepID=UPI0037F72B98
MIDEAVHTAEVIVWGAIASFAFLAVSVAGLAVTAGAAAADAIARRYHVRRAIHRLEHEANHPGARRLLNDIRKETNP